MLFIQVEPSKEKHSDPKIFLGVVILIVFAVYVVVFMNTKMVQHEPWQGSSLLVPMPAVAGVFKTDLAGLPPAARLYCGINS